MKNNIYIARKMALLLLLICFVLNGSTKAQTAPGGVGKNDGTTALRLWLKADAGVTGTPISQWNDQSGRNNHLTQSAASNRPTLTANAINGFPALTFDNNDFLSLNNLLGSELFDNDSATIFFVKRSTGGVVWFTWESASSNRFGFELSSNNTRFDCPNPNSGQGQLVDTVSVVNRWRQITAMKQSTNQSIFLKNVQKTTFTYSPVLTLNTTLTGNLVVGKYQGGALNWTGDIAEIIVYKTALNTPQRNIVENYLKAKYNLAVDGANYYQGYAATYINDIVGIGSTSSTVKQAATQTTSGGLWLSEANNSLTGTAFLMAGHNGATTADAVTDLPTGFTNHWTREWYLRKTNSLDAQLTFDFADAGRTAPTSANGYALFYRNATTGTYSVVNTSATVLQNGDQISFTVPNAFLQNGYYTIGYSTVPAQTFYSYNGNCGGAGCNFNVAANWTTDPSGTTWVNANNIAPRAIDDIVILAGHKVNVTANNQAKANNLSLFGTLDMSTFNGGSFTTVSGQGLLRIASPNFITGNTTAFLSSGGGTVEYYGASAFNVPNLSGTDRYYNIIFSGAGIKTLQDSLVVSGDVTIQTGATLSAVANKITLNQGNWINNSGTYTANTATRVSFIGTATQTITGATNFKLLNITSTAKVVMASASINADTLGVFGQLDLTTTPSHAFGRIRGTGLLRSEGDNWTIGDHIGSFTRIGGGTAEYYGAGSYLLSASVNNFNHLTVTGGGTKTMQTGITINGDLTIGANTTFSDAGVDLNDIVLYGNWVNNGTYSATQNEVTFKNNAVNQSVTGVTTFHSLTLDMAAGRSIILSANTDVRVDANLSLKNGKIVLSDNTLRLSDGAGFVVPVGGFDNTRMIQQDGTNGSGSLVIKEGADMSEFQSLLIPIGTNSDYTPVSLSSVSGSVSGTATIAFKSIPFASAAPNILKRYWRIETTSLAGISNAILDFYFVSTDLTGNPTVVNRVEDGLSNTVTGSYYNLAGLRFGVSGLGNNYLTQDWRLGSSLVIPKTYYTYGAGGTWSGATTWTTDITGQDLVEPPAAGPTIQDVAVILNGGAVTMNVNNAKVTSLTILEGGSLDINTTTGHNFGTVSGQGLIKTVSTTLPTATYTSFLSANGGTVEYDATTSFNLSALYPSYKNLIINLANATDTVSVATGVFASDSLVLYGNLMVLKGIVRLNTSSASAGNAVVLNVMGDASVAASAQLRVGNRRTLGAYNSVSGGLNASTIPTWRYHFLYNRMYVGGNFTNNGIVRFSNLAQPVYDRNDSTGAAVLWLKGAANNTMQLNNTTDLYNLIIDKGTDRTFVLTLNSADSTYLRLFGRNECGNAGGGNNPEIRKALWIRNGMLKLTGSISIPTLTEGTGGGSPNSDFYIPANGALWIADDKVRVYNTIDSYAQSNVGGLTGTMVSTALTGGAQSFSIYGLFRITAGKFESRNCGGFIFWSNADGIIQIEGGTVIASQLRSAGSAGGKCSFLMSGGQLSLKGRGYGGSGTQSLFGTFSISQANNVFNMSGGRITITDVIGSGNSFIPSGGTIPSANAFEVQSTVDNYSVTGGTVDIWVKSNSGSYNYEIGSTAPIYNLILTKTDASPTVFARNLYAPLVVSNDFTLSSSVGAAFEFQPIRTNVSVANNFSLGANVVYAPDSTNYFTFNGAGNTQTATLNGTLKPAFYNLAVNNLSGTVNLAGSLATVPVLNRFRLLSGTLNDGGKIVQAFGNVTNNATHTGTGQIKLNSAALQTIAVTAQGSGYTSVPTVTLSGGGGAGATAQAYLSLGTITITNGGANYASTPTVNIGGKGYGASATAVMSGGVITAINITNAGYGYEGLATISLSGGTQTSPATVAATFSVMMKVSEVRITNAGSGYTSVPTVSFAGGAGTGAAATATIGGAQVMAGSGSGIFSNLNIDNTNGVTSTANQAVTGTLTLTNGVLNIQQYGLDLSSTAAISVSSPSTSRMIKTNGQVSDVGITKTFTAATGTFVFPVGSATYYTPAVVQVLSASNYGAINLKPVNDFNPFLASNNALRYYWKLNSTGFTGSKSLRYKFKYTGLTINGTESNYIPGYFDVTSSLNWTNETVSDMNITADTIRFDGTGSGVNYINGDYTAGQVDAFQSTVAFYSRNSGDWDNPNSWSTVSHTGAVASSTPSVGNPVFVGAGHTITLTSNNKACGALKIESDGIVDIGTSTGHNFGALFGEKISGSGLMRISSATATAEFPRGDFGQFLTCGGGTVEYYTTASQDFLIPSLSASSGSLSNYNYLIINSLASRAITLPNTNLNICKDLTAKGAGTAYISANTNGDITVGNNLKVSAGILQYPNAINRTVSVANNVAVSAGATFNVNSTGTATHAMTIGGSLYNDGTFDMFSAGSLCNTTFTGAANDSIAGTGSTTDFARLTLDKGTSQANTLEVNVSNISISGSLSGSTKALTLKNGTFYFNTNNAGNAIAFTNDNTAWFIPATAQLWLNNGTFQVTQNNVSGGILLSGKIKVSGSATLNIANTTPSGSVENYIEYSGAGNPAIEITGGALTVGSQIRRNPNVPTGSLNYTQTGGTVRIGHNVHAPQAGRGVLEVLNTGSNFTMTAGTLYLLTPQTSTPTIAALYLQPENSLVTGGTIYLGNNTTTITPSARTYRVNVSIPLWNLELANSITSDRPDASLDVNGLNVRNNLVLNYSSNQFITNGLPVNIGGNFTNNGTYTAGGNRTTFDGNVVAQSLNGTSYTTFNKLTINNTNALGVVSPVTVGFTVTDTLSLLAGTLHDNGLTLTALGNVYNAATHSSAAAGNLVLAAATQQSIGGNGNGKFGRLILNNTAGALMTASQTINTELALTDGILDIQEFTLTFNESATVSGVFGLSRMIRTTGQLSTGGVTKKVAAGAFDFTFPIGVSSTPSKYTPARFVATANTAAGSINIIPVNASHPLTDMSILKELGFYWRVTASGMANLSVKNLFYYDQSDVKGNESAYVAAVLKSGTVWGFGTTTTGTVNVTDNEIRVDGGFNTSNGGVNFITGDYTTGESDEFKAIQTYISAQNGNWDNPNTWTIAQVPPTGVPVIIDANHTVTISANVKRVNSLIVRNNAILALGTTVGHNFGTVSGTGTIQLGLGTFPAGNYAAFTSEGGGTVEYTGNAYTLPTQNVYNNLKISSSGSLTMPNRDLVLNGNFVIASGTTVNTTYNRNIKISGDIQSEVANGYAQGTGSITMAGTGLQAIKGTMPLSINRFIVQKTSGAVMLQQKLIIRDRMTFSSGNIYLYNDTLEFAASITVSGGNASSYVVTNGTGALKRRLTTSGTTMAFHVGDAVYFTPFNFRLNAGTLNQSFVSVRVTDQPHAQRGATSSYLNRYWTLEPYNITGLINYNVSYYYGSTDEAVGDNTNPLFKPYKYSGGTWTSGGTHTLASKLCVWSSVTSFSDFTAGIDMGAVPLPISLLHFDAIAQDNHTVQVIWQTASEINNSHFIVERSADGKNFEYVGTVKGAGNSTSLLHYGLTDHQPYAGKVSYYRLKQIDFDGKFTYSSLAVVHLLHHPVSLQWVVFPNPADMADEVLGDLSAYEGQQIVVKVTDILGKEHLHKDLWVEPVSANKTILFLAKDYPTGIYTLSITDEKGDTETQRLVVKQ